MSRGQFSQISINMFFIRFYFVLRIRFCSFFFRFDLVAFYGRRLVFQSFPPLWLQGIGLVAMLVVAPMRPRRISTSSCYAISFVITIDKTGAAGQTKPA